MVRCLKSLSVEKEKKNTNYNYKNSCGRNTVKSFIITDNFYKIIDSYLQTHALLRDSLSIFG